MLAHAETQTKNVNAMNWPEAINYEGANLALKMPYRFQGNDEEKIGSYFLPFLLSSRAAVENNVVITIVPRADTGNSDITVVPMISIVCGTVPL